MLPLSPLSFIYALILCLPLAIIFTVISPISNDLVPLPPPPPPLLSKADESLLRVAARVDPRPTRPKKLAFMFLTATPLPFAPLWELYFSKAPKGLFNVYVHADPTRRYDPPFSGVFANRTVRAEPTRRNTPGLAAAARRLLAHALLDDPANAMFALLSPSCVPLRPFSSAYAALLGGPERSFVEILARESGSHGRWAARGASAMLPEVRLEEFRIGSQFWVMTRRHARLVSGDRRLWAKFGLSCVRVSACYPEENYFPTLLAMHDPAGCVPATLTHVNWTGRSNGHPRSYGGSEVRAELIIELRKARPRYGDDATTTTLSSSISSSSFNHFNFSLSDIRQTRHHSFLFARKFAPNAIGPLMSLAHSVILRER